MLEGLFFDLYGTLLVYGDMETAWADWLAAVHARLRRIDHPVPRERLVTACEGFFTWPLSQERRGDLTAYERRIARLLVELGVEPESGRIRRIAADSVSAWQQHVSLDPDARTVLAAARRQVAVALITNFDHPPHVHEVLRKTGLVDLFDCVVVSGDVGFKKPDPRIFAIALKQLGLAANKVAYIGDAREDVEGAEASGLLPVRLHRTAAEWQATVSGANGRLVLDAPPWEYEGANIASLGEALELLGDP